MEKIEKIEKIHNFIDINRERIVLFTTVIFCISFLAVVHFTDLIIDHDSEKIYNRMESIVEKSKEEIIALSKYDRSEIEAGDNITIIVKQQNITVVNDAIYSQYYIVDNNSLKKEGESMYFSIYASSCCFVIFFISLALSFFSSVILCLIIDLIVLIIIKISERIKLYRLTRNV